MKSAPTHRETKNTDPVRDKPQPSRLAAAHGLCRPLTLDSVGQPAVALGNVFASSSSGPLPLQTKLTVNEPGDQYEQEADRVAEQVMLMPDTILPLQRKCGCGVQANDECRECGAKQRLLQRHVASDAHAAAVPAVVADVLRSPGQPLDISTRALMEARFGFNFGDVRLHRDARAGESAQAVNALAYTVGKHVVFGSGQYKPDGIPGQRLIAHELAHVVQQQGSSGSLSSYKTSHPSDHAEQDAERAALAIVENRPLPRLDPIATGIHRDAGGPQRGPDPSGTSQSPGPAPQAAPRGPADFTEEEVVEAGLIAVGQVLQSVVAPEAGVLRDIYNQGAARITAERARLVAQNLPEAQIAERLSGMRHELAESVRRTGSSLMRKGAELFDAVRGNVGRPTYESLRAAGRTDARIIERAAETNRFINRLPSGLRWTGRALWVVQVGLSIYIVLQAPPEARGEAARLEVEGLIGGGAGAFIGEGICVVAGIATEGLGLILCGLIGGGLGFEGARRGHLLEVLDIAPHQIPALAGTIYRIEGAFEESDFFIFSVVHRTVSASENILVVATGLRSGEQVGGRGHYHSLEVTPSNPPAVQLFGNTQARLVPEYLLRIATPDDLRRSRD